MDLLNKKQVTTPSNNKKAFVKYQVLQTKTDLIKPGAYQMFEYLPKIKGKRVGIFTNHTATVGNTHLVDTLQKLGLKLPKYLALNMALEALQMPEKK